MPCRSIRRWRSLPPQTRPHQCREHRPGGRAAAWKATVALQRASNAQVRDGVAGDEFVAPRTACHRTLAMPVLVLPSVQAEVRAGRSPPAGDNGEHHPSIPINLL